MLAPVWYKGFQQPQGSRLTIDWDHPLARGLQFAIVFNTAGRARSLIRGDDADTEHVLSDSELGYGRDASTAADTVFSRVLSQSVMGQYDGSMRISVLAGCEINVSGAADVFRIGDTPGSTGTYRMRLDNWSSSVSKMAITGGWSAQGAKPATLFDLDPWPKPWLWAWDQLSTEYRFSDGLTYAEGTATGGHANDVSPRDEMDFVVHATTQLDRLSYVYVWNKLLSVGDHQWVGSEPYAFIVPEAVRTIFLPVAAAGGGAYTAELSAPAFSFTAQALTHLAAFVGTLTAPAFNFAAQALEVREAYTAELSAPAFNFTGQALEVQAEYRATLSAPSFNFTAQDLELVGAQDVLLDVAAFNFTAQQITVSEPFLAALSAPAFNFTGFPLTIPGDPAPRGVSSPLTDGQGVSEQLTDGEGVG